MVIDNNLGVEGSELEKINSEHQPKKENKLNR